MTKNEFSTIGSIVLVLALVISAPVAFVCALVHNQKLADERFAAYSKSHHCQETANYFDVVREYTCDGGEKITR